MGCCQSRRIRNACSPVSAVVTSYPTARSHCARVSRKIGLLSTTRMRSEQFLFMVASRALPRLLDGLSATQFEARFSWPLVSETYLGSALFSQNTPFEQTGAIGVLKHTCRKTGCKIVSPHGNKPGSGLVWIRQRSISTVDAVMPADGPSSPRSVGMLSS